MELRIILPQLPTRTRENAVSLVQQSIVKVKKTKIALNVKKI